MITCSDLERSLRFWVDGLGLQKEREILHEEKLIGCMVHNDHTAFWLSKRAGTLTKPEDYEGIPLYWAPNDIHNTLERLRQLGYEVSMIKKGDYGQTEFFSTDDDGHSHCFGVESV